MKPSEPWTEIGRGGRLVEVVEFNGTRYRRLPDSIRPSSRDYFRFGGNRKLHRDIWEYHNGPIPEGHHIHHKDGNTLNNDIGNLELLTPKEHAAIHGEERSTSPEWNAHLQEIQPLAQAGRKIVDAVCVVCGKNFQAVLGRHPKFCSDACCAKDFRDRGMGLKEGTCEFCGKTFFSRTSGQATCSRECGILKQIQVFRDKAETREPVKKNCKVCGVLFDDVSHHRRKVYCSGVCQRFQTRPPKSEKLRARFFEKKGLAVPRDS